MAPCATTGPHVLALIRFPVRSDQVSVWAAVAEDGLLTPNLIVDAEAVLRGNQPGPYGLRPRVAPRGLVD